MDDEAGRARGPYMIVASTADGTRALELAAELRGLAAQLERQAFGVEAPDGVRGSGDAATLAPYARAVSAARRALAEDLGDTGGIDPMLDVLLDMFAAGGEGGSIVADAREDAAPPSPAAARWTAALRDRDLIEEREGGARLVLGTRGTSAIRSFLHAISAASHVLRPGDTAAA